MTPQQVHDLGLKEAKRIRERMKKVCYINMGYSEIVLGIGTSFKVESINNLTPPHERSR